MSQSLRQRRKEVKDGTGSIDVLNSNEDANAVINDGHASHEDTGANASTSKREQAVWGKTPGGQGNSLLVKTV